MTGGLLVEPVRVDCRMHLRVQQHLLALDADDRYGRFATPLGDAGIAAYVRGIDFAGDLCFTTLENDGSLSGFIHLARVGDVAELGASVSAGRRGQGRATRLFSVALAEAGRAGMREVLLAVGHPAARHICRALGYALVEGTGYPRVRVQLPAGPSHPEARRNAAFSA